MKTQEEDAIYKPRTEVSKETNPANTLVWDFQPPELCVSPPGHGNCCDHPRRLIQPPSVYSSYAGFFAAPQTHGQQTPASGP